MGLIFVLLDWSWLLSLTPLPSKPRRFLSKTSQYSCWMIFVGDIWDDSSIEWQLPGWTSHGSSPAKQVVWKALSGFCAFLGGECLEYSYVFMAHLANPGFICFFDSYEWYDDGWFMTVHDSSWQCIFMMTVGESWSLMLFHDCAWWVMLLHDCSWRWQWCRFMIMLHDDEWCFKMMLHGASWWLVMMMMMMMMLLMINKMNMMMMMMMMMMMTVVVMMWWWW